MTKRRLSYVEGVIDKYWDYFSAMAIVGIKARFTRYGTEHWLKKKKKVDTSTIISIKGKDDCVC